MWNCVICNKEVYPNPDTGEPSSKYWKGMPTIVRNNKIESPCVVERCYCSADCGLKDYQSKQT